MAFCTGCGTKIEDNVKFCPGCGRPAGAATQPQAAMPAPATPAAPAATAPAPAQYSAPAAAPAAKQGGGALKIVLIIVGVFVLLGVLVVGMIGYGIYRAKKAVENATSTFKVETRGDRTSVETPFGKVTGGEKSDAFKVAKDLGIEVYPGATPINGSAATMNIGGVTIGGADFETGDDVDKVGQFYRARYPNSTFSASDEKSRSMMVNGAKGVIMLNIEKNEERGKTKIGIALMGGGQKPQ